MCRKALIHMHIYNISIDFGTVFSYQLYWYLYSVFNLLVVLFLSAFNLLNPVDRCCKLASCCKHLVHCIWCLCMIVRCSISVTAMAMSTIQTFSEQKQAEKEPVQFKYGSCMEPPVWARYSLVRINITHLNHFPCGVVVLLNFYYRKVISAVSLW